MFREIEWHTCNSVSSSNSEDGNLRHGHGIDSYGISVTTLEEVFLRVTGCDSEEVEPVEPGSSFQSDDIIRKRVSCNKLWGSYRRITGLIACIIAKGFGIIIAALLGFWTFISFQCCSYCFASGSTFWVHFKALYTKRLRMAQRDRKTIIFQLLIPAVFLFFGLLLLSLKPHPDQQSVTFTTSYFNPLLGGGGGGGPIPFDLSSQISTEVNLFPKFVILSNFLFCIFVLQKHIELLVLLKIIFCRLQIKLKGGGSKGTNQLLISFLMRRRH